MAAEPDSSRKASCIGPGEARARVLPAETPLAFLLLPCTRCELVQLLELLTEEARRLRDAGLAPGAPSRVELLVVMDGPMTVINKRAMGSTGPTNILSFPADPLDGEASLVLSAETFTRECLLYGQDRREHLVRLLCHGMGHVCGFDHGPAMDRLTAALESAAALWPGEGAHARG